MTRINIYHTNDYGERTLAGWFDPTAPSTELFDQDSFFDGANMVGVITRQQMDFVDEHLYRTAGGRWVRHHNARRYFNGSQTFEFLDDKQALDWLIRSECNDDAIERLFGEMADEEGPRPGRPEIGPMINVRLPSDLLARVDAEAASRGTSRAETIRSLLAAALKP